MRIDIESDSIARITCDECGTVEDIMYVWCTAFGYDCFNVQDELDRLKWYADTERDLYLCPRCIHTLASHTEG